MLSRYLDHFSRYRHLIERILREVYSKSFVCRWGKGNNIIIVSHKYRDVNQLLQRYVFPVCSRRREAAVTIESKATTVITQDRAKRGWLIASLGLTSSTCCQLNERNTFSSFPFRKHFGITRAIDVYCEITILEILICLFIWHICFSSLIQL